MKAIRSFTHKRSSACLLASLAFLFCLPLQGALTAYLKIGDIKGESQRVDHEDEIDIHDIQWNVERGDDSATSGTSISFGDLKLRKYLDKATPLLMESCATGKVIPSATFSVRKDSGDAHLDYLIITMENVVVTSVDIAGTDGTQLLQESISLSYEKITVKYTVQMDDHSAGETVSFNWDVSKNAPG